MGEEIHHPTIFRNQNRPKNLLNHNHSVHAMLSSSIPCIPTGSRTCTNNKKRRVRSKESEELGRSKMQVKNPKLANPNQTGQCRWWNERNASTVHLHAQQHHPDLDAPPVPVTIVAALLQCQRARPLHLHPHGVSTSALCRCRLICSGRSTHPRAHGSVSGHPQARGSRSTRPDARGVGSGPVVAAALVRATEEEETVARWMMGRTRRMGGGGGRRGSTK